MVGDFICAVSIRILLTAISYEEAHYIVSILEVDEHWLRFVSQCAFRTEGVGLKLFSVQIE